ncbi:MAG: MBL fold metallo-hydrolase [Desulfobacterota bacterium]|nr:MBL fold metallo-hydrolase [Thermodesulfobacteriota bacterium]MDW8002323.1 MBL fold metallo-hydrolase [Deltaproteobacteria bacterium]
MAKKNLIFLTTLLLFSFFISSFAQTKKEKDVIRTARGDLTIHFIGHGSLMMEWQNKVIHIDPYGKMADYSKLPKADLILITHHHPDHFDPDAIAKIKKNDTVIVYTKKCEERLKGGIVIANGERKTVLGIPIQAVPAYNLVHKRETGVPFHPKGEGNGYVLTFEDVRIYVAGDTENIPEMKDLKGIDIAFLPMNLPYTMTPEMVKDAALMIRPKVLYPYHFGETDPTRIVELLKDHPEIEVRIRDMR